MRHLLLLSLGLFACSGGSTDDDDKNEEEDTLENDDDGDGLSNGEEEELGLDPDEADTDGDGLDDGDEIEVGTNPNFEFSVPLELGDYVLGKCPVVPSEESGPTGMGTFTYQGEVYEWEAYAEGDTIDNWTGLDAYGQEVSIYNFCGNYTLVSFGAAWCGPCQSFAATLADEMEEMLAERSDFTFFELLSQNVRGNEPTESQLDQWEEEFGLQGIPVVGPQDADQTAGLGPWDADGYIPSFILLSPDMKVMSFDENLNSVRQIVRAIEDWEE